MPSKEEWLELKNWCDWAEETLGGVAGIRATSLKNGKSIFFPYAGLMTSEYTTGGNCWEITLPWFYDFYTHSMMNTLVSVRAVK